MSVAILIPVPGLSIGMMTLISKSSIRKNEWIARCKCGTEKSIRFRALVSGHIVSCGCYGKARRAEVCKKHGHIKDGKKSRTYQSWQHMLERCQNPTSHNAKNYSKKGITVCAQWAESFDNFLHDMGERPAGKTLDRIDNKGNYSYENCRWATTKEQAQNTSQCKLNMATASEIRALKNSGRSGRNVAKEYSISHHRIYDIWHGRAWA